MAQPPYAPYPPPRRRTGLVVGGLVVVSLVVIGLVIALSGSDDDAPAVSACDLLSGDQLTGLLGEAPDPVIDRAPSEQDDTTTTDCRWSSDQADVLIILRTLPSPDDAMEEYEDACFRVGTEVSVAGADQSCRIFAASDSVGTVNGARVVARTGQMMVEVTYIKLGQLPDSSEQTAITTTTAVLDKLSS